QHLKSVEAAAAISNASVDGAQLNSQELVFRPEAVNPGRYHFSIGTAGSTSLVLQTIFIPLALSGGTSHVTITGGTHVPHSPCFHYVDLQWMAFMRRIGYRGKIQMEQAGFYPQGGGKLLATIQPAGEIHSIELIQRGPLRKISGISAVANLDPGIAKRQKHRALQRLEPAFPSVKIKEQELKSTTKGTFLLILGEFAGSSCCYFALGERGKPAERVADEAVDAFEACIATEAAIDQYLADQLLLPLAFADGESRLHTAQVTTHLLTNAEIIHLFTPAKITIEGNLGEPGWVTLQPK
ncbi:MAG: RNA 3'-terminal phosphate cyclase, partial [Omnitrophica WOR_2 bacterium]